MIGNLVHITTFGCQMNEYDSERIAGLLERSGYILTEKPAGADIILFNTCSVRDSAEQRLFGRVWELKPLKEDNPDLIIAICGCMGQQYGEQIIDKIPIIDLVMGPRQIPYIADYIEEVQYHRKPIVKIGFDDPYQHEDIVKRSHPVKAYVSIMEGCNHLCTFCIVPYTRGKQVNRPMPDIIKQIQNLATEGIKEITLLGQNVDAWRNKGYHFGDLLKAVNDIDGIERIRYTSPHPSHITDSVINSIGAAPKVCENFHLPVQSGSNKILQNMKRAYTIEKYKQIIDIIRSRWPDAGITSDLVVGFPGESDADFALTLQLIDEIKFDNAFCFMFSPRSGTPAADMDNQIPLEIRKKRVKELIDNQSKITANKLKLMIGNKYEILVEGFSQIKKNQFIGRTRSNIVTAFPSDNSILPGNLIQIKIIDASSHILFGEYCINPD